jgi:hypothetical protein
MSNASMPGIFKVGMTVRTPEERLAEANSSDTWRPPTEYKIAFSVPVLDVSTTESLVHEQLDEHRIHPRREFFNAPFETIKEILSAVRCEPKVKSAPKPLVRSARYIHLRSGTLVDRCAE